MKWIEKCLNSVLASSVPLQIIIVDNKSTDQTVQFLKSNYEKITICEQHKNLGFGVANNIGLKKAYDDGANYVFLLNQDAWIEPCTIELLIATQQKEPEYGVVSPMHLNGFGNSLDFNFSQYIMPKNCLNLYSDIFLNKVKSKLYETKFINAAGWLLSRKCMENIGGFNPCFFHYGEDDNYINRLHFHKLKIGVLATTVLYHDRELRSQNPYFDNHLIAYKRDIVLKASNPLVYFSIDSEYKKLYKNCIKSIIVFNFKMLKDLMNKIRVLNQLDRRQIEKRKNESKLINPTFIN